MTIRAVLLLTLWLSMVARAEVLVTDAYVFAPLPGQSTTVAYADIENRDAHELVLTEVRVPEAAHWAARVEMHQHVHDNGMMQMRSLPALSLAAGERQHFAPGGLHLMVFGVTHAEPGQVVPVDLCWQYKGQSWRQRIDLRVRSR